MCGLADEICFQSKREEKEFLKEKNIRHFILMIEVVQLHSVLN